MGKKHLPLYEHRLGLCQLKVTLENVRSIKKSLRMSKTGMQKIDVVRQVGLAFQATHAMMPRIDRFADHMEL